MTTIATEPRTPPPTVAAPNPPFGVNEMRLSGREWLVAIVIVLICTTLAPRVWTRFETFSPGPDYRIPYALSNDYWLYQRRLEQLPDVDTIPIVGDSVVWGEYVLPDGTLSHFLNQDASGSAHFVNCGVNGLFPLAMEGLVEDYGRTLRNRKIIVQCNLLWLTSPKADLSSTEEESFNHSRLVPQFAVRIPCYRADANQRLSAEIERHFNYFAWTTHLQEAYYDHRSIAGWTLIEDGSEPPGYPNAWRNPIAPLARGVPGEPRNDPQRGPASPRHRPWTAGGGEPTHFEWVDPDHSLQWQAFQRVIRLLHDRGNDVLVLLGPFNEHMIAPDQREEYRMIRDHIAGQLREQHVPLIVPELIPSALYADASHPLTDGYALLARQLTTNPQFQQWMTAHQAR